MPPVIYWVVGNNTDIGKTTVSAALIRVLNRRGVPALGLKPFAAARMLGNVDFFITLHASRPGMLAGRDALALAAASPLTSADLLEIVAPVQFLCHPSWQDVILARCGSATLGDLAIYKPAGAPDFAARPDMRALARRLRLPFEQARPVGQIRPASAHHLPGNAPARAFEHLCSLGPAAVVCEGAGPLLPVWHGHPAVDHVLVIREGMAQMFAGAGLMLPPKDALPRAPSIADLQPRLAARAGAAPLAAQADVDAWTEHTIEALLEAAGLP